MGNEIRAEQQMRLECISEYLTIKEVYERLRSVGISVSAIAIEPLAERHRISESG